jgi:hypothetical protein
VPRRVWIGEELLHHLLRCYFRAVLGERRPQSRQQLYSDACLIGSAREVSRRPTCLFGPTTTSMLRNLQQQFPIGVQPIVKTWRLQWLSEPTSRGTVTGQRTSRARLRASCPTSRTSEHSSAGATGCDVRMFGCLPLDGPHREGGLFAGLRTY